MWIFQDPFSHNFVKFLSFSFLIFAPWLHWRKRERTQMMPLFFQLNDGKWKYILRMSECEHCENYCDHVPNSSDTWIQDWLTTRLFFVPFSLWLKHFEKHSLRHFTHHHLIFLYHSIRWTLNIELHWTSSGCLNTLLLISICCCHNEQWERRWFPLFHVFDPLPIPSAPFDRIIFRLWIDGTKVDGKICNMALFAHDSLRCIFEMVINFYRNTQNFFLEMNKHNYHSLYLYKK